MSTASKLKNSTSTTAMFDVQNDFKDNVDGLLIRRSQHIPDQFISDLKQQKMASSGVREKDYMKVASIPVAVLDTWAAQGYDIYKMTAKEIIKKLQAEHLDAFITTTKQF